MYHHASFFLLWLVFILLLNIYFNSLKNLALSGFNKIINTGQDIIS